MDYRKLFILAITMAWVSSCGYKVPNPEDAIVGTYEVQSIEVSDCDDPANNNDGSDLGFGCYVEKQYQICYSISIQFTGDRDYIFSKNTRTIDQAIGTVLYDRDAKEGYYFIEGNELRLCFNGNCENATFTREGKTLKLVIEKEEGCSETIMATKN